MNYCNLIINGEKFSMLDREEAERVARMERHINPNADIRFEDNAKSDLDELNLSTRNHNILVRAGVLTIADLEEHENELSKVRNLGRRGVAEVLEKLTAYRTRA